MPADPAWIEGYFSIIHYFYHRNITFFGPSTHLILWIILKFHRWQCSARYKYDIWYCLWEKWLYHSWISNYIPQYTVVCKYLSITYIPQFWLNYYSINELDPLFLVKKATSNRRLLFEWFWKIEQIGLVTSIMYSKVSSSVYQDYLPHFSTVSRWF